MRRRLVHGFVITENWFAPGLQIDRHEHAHSHFTFVLDGAFTESYDRIVLECVPGSILFVPARALHTDRVGPEGAHTIGVELSAETAVRIAPSTGLFVDAHVLAERKLEQAGLRLYREFRSGDPTSSISMESIALEMMTLSARMRNRGRQGEPAWMVTVREILHTGFRGRVALGEVARAVGIHQTHLARAFRERHGCTVGEYVHRLRVDAAATELKRGHQSIGDIATSVGYYDQSHFCRVFKRAYGSSPSEYRSR